MNRPERLPSRYKPFLWAVGQGTETQVADDMIQNRFRVVSPRIWLDTQPDQRPPVPDSLPDAVHPYLQAHRLRLHVPGVYGVLEFPGQPTVLLLENAPIHPQSGELCPAIETQWSEVRALRQLQWLWQGWDLWRQLQPLALGSSLLSLENLRVEGWRLRLRELYVDSAPLSDADWITAWKALAKTAKPAVSRSLQDWMTALTESSLQVDDFENHLNELFLSEAAQTTVRIAIAGATTSGPDIPRNEDACYPEGRLDNAAEDALQVGIVCDGVGGHDGGEVASRLAIQSFQLQLRGLLAETQEEGRVLPPRVIQSQIEAVIRIVNDLINHQNDMQARVGRQRMGTTLVMVLKVSQRVPTPNGLQKADEFYIAHVGDSRVYWITPDYCHCLTVDDDIAGREVQAGRQIFPLAQEHPEAQALTQALGTRSIEHLTPHIQRFVVDETGVLLLCSDGLSDNARIEDAWANYIGLIVKDIVPLESAVASWLELANQKNGHDNTSVVLMHCKAFAKSLETEPDTTTAEPAAAAAPEPSRAYLYGETPEEDVPTPTASGTPSKQSFPVWAWVVGGLVVIVALLSWFLMNRPTAVDPPIDPGIEDVN